MKVFKIVKSSNPVISRCILVVATEMGLYKYAVLSLGAEGIVQVAIYIAKSKIMFYLEVHKKPNIKNFGNSNGCFILQISRTVSLQFTIL